MILDEVTKVLLNHAKSEYSEFTWKALSNILAPMYHYDMKLVDVLHVVAMAYETICNEPKFSVEFNLQDLLLAPTGSSVNLKTSMTIEQYYNKVIDHMMCRMRESKVSWCLINQIGH
jgi:hypothetical protein